MSVQNNTVKNWIIYSIILVVGPVLVAILVYRIVNDKFPAYSELLDSAILIVFSVTSSLVSLCVELKNKKKNFDVICIYWIAVALMSISWSMYLLCLANMLSNRAECLCLVTIIIVIICFVMGIYIGNESEKIEIELIKNMHNNCELIRKELVSKNNNDKLLPLSNRDNDLLCDPTSFDRVEQVLNSISRGENNDKN